MSDLEFVPLVILGATRSGTNALRNSLISLPTLDTWPCDEINGIWKYRSLSGGYDSLSRGDLTRAKKKYIRSRFIKQFYKLGKPDILVEKTCANTLRPSFVSGVFPEAKYIYIIRDGAEVIKSAKRRWEGEFEYNLLEYWFDKVKFIPGRDLFHYVYDVGVKRLKKKIFRRSALETWGPTHPTLDKFKSECSLDDLVSLQWALCVISSWRYFGRVGPKKCVFITYEFLLNNPEAVLSQVSSLVGVNFSSRENIELFSSGLFAPPKNVEPYIPDHPVVKRYYNRAMAIYRKIEDAVNKKRDG